jgi:hypothetical protein
MSSTMRTATICKDKSGKVYQKANGDILLWAQPVNTGEDAKIQVRVAHPLASNRFGFFGLPREGDEVLLAFPENSAPVVIGSLFNSNNKYPYYFDGDDSIENLNNTYGMRVGVKKTPPDNDATTEGDNDITTQADKDKYDGPIVNEKSFINKTEQVKNENFISDACKLSYAEERAHNDYHEISFHTNDQKTEHGKWTGTWAGAAYGEGISETLGEYNGALNIRRQVTPGVRDVLDSVKEDHFEGIRVRSRNNILQESSNNTMIQAGQYITIEADKGIALKVGNTQIKISSTGIKIMRPQDIKPYYARKGTTYKDAPSEPLGLPGMSTLINIEGVMIEAHAFRINTTATWHSSMSTNFWGILAASHECLLHKSSINAPVANVEARSTLAQRFDAIFDSPLKSDWNQKKTSFAKKAASIAVDVVELMSQLDGLVMGIFGIIAGTIAEHSHPVTFSQGEDDDILYQDDSGFANVYDYFFAVILVWEMYLTTILELVKSGMLVEILVSPEGSTQVLNVRGKYGDYPEIISSFRKRTECTRLLGGINAIINATNFDATGRKVFDGLELKETNLLISETRTHLGETSHMYTKKSVEAVETAIVAAKKTITAADAEREELNKKVKSGQITIEAAKHELKALLLKRETELVEHKDAIIKASSRLQNHQAAMSIKT